jgi:hypothetical protein
MQQENKKRNAMYALPCKFNEEDYEEIFFITFNTKNEREALRLASCVCGKDSNKSLVIITEDGEYYDCS